MSKIFLLCVGKMKDKDVLKIEADYHKRLSQFDLNIIELKAHSEDVEKEAQEIEKKCAALNLSPVLLTENGKQMSSPQFSNWLTSKLEQSSKVAFIIGGAAGFSKGLREKNYPEISLGKMTYPHRLARLLIVEQIYRAECIFLRHPYHK